MVVQYIASVAVNVRTSEVELLVCKCDTIYLVNRHYSLLTDNVYSFIFTINCGFTHVR